eukprot:TRINITY_DN4396_c0_g1_i5.p3 TRINITY_DN4396_c0_g1~~TRINITY_DN4396_c0_g1_i5.p3  ORF type:complete len:112 (-),score=4.38 TRINITY_DN4396_c0_g1_i5:104-439(-)
MLAQPGTTIVFRVYTPLFLLLALGAPPAATQPVRTILACPSEDDVILSLLVEVVVQTLFVIGIWQVGNLVDYRCLRTIVDVGSIRSLLPYPVVLLICSLMFVMPLLMFGRS